MLRVRCHLGQRQLALDDEHAACLVDRVLAEPRATLRQRTHEVIEQRRLAGAGLAVDEHLRAPGHDAVAHHVRLVGGWQVGQLPDGVEPVEPFGCQHVGQRTGQGAFGKCSQGVRVQDVGRVTLGRRVRPLHPSDRRRHPGKRLLDALHMGAPNAIVVGPQDHWPACQDRECRGAGCRFCAADGAHGRDTGPVQGIRGGLALGDHDGSPRRDGLQPFGTVQGQVRGPDAAESLLAVPGPPHLLGTVGPVPSRMCSMLSLVWRPSATRAGQRRSAMTRGRGVPAEPFAFGANRSAIAMPIAATTASGVQPA